MASQHPTYTELTPSLTDRIHNEIKLYIAQARFPVISFQSGLRRTLLQTVKAKSILVRPQQSGFRESKNRSCGGRLQDRNGWVWIVLVHFDRQVDLDAFETRLMRDPLRIPRDVDLTQQIDISLLDVVYEHPAEKQSSTGTKVTYRMQADLTQL